MTLLCLKCGYREQVKNGMCTKCFWATILDKRKNG